MFDALENRFYVSGYLLLILRDYLKDCALLYKTLEEYVKSVKIIWGPFRDLCLARIS